MIGLMLTQSGSALTYDGIGNPLSDQAGVRTFTYNNANRLSTVTDNALLTATYTYNALGQRANKVTASSDIDYVYGLQGELLGEYVNGALIQEYVYMGTTPVAQLDSGTTWLHADHLGTPRVGTNGNGTVVWRWDSDPFGEAAPAEDPDGDMTDVTVNLRFPGQYADMETGQYYNYFRTYDSSIGRYTQSDPIGLQGGLNTYAYAYDDPVNLTDVYGLRPVTHGDCGGAPGCTMNTQSGASRGSVGLFLGLGPVTANLPLQGGSPSVTQQYTVGVGLSFCLEEPNREKPAEEFSCPIERKSNCGIYDPNCDNETGHGSVSPVGKFRAWVSVSSGPGGSLCLNVGPHIGIPGLPVVHMGSD